MLQAGGLYYTYDANGNRLSQSGDGQNTAYTYNSKNHLISRMEAAGDLHHYRYNPDGIRHQQSTGLDTESYLVDSNRDYAQVLVEYDALSTQVQYHYGDDLISQTRGSATSYYHYDGLGSTRALSDAAGSFTDSYDYEAFGEVLAQSGSTENSYLFTGEQYDEGLDQYYLRARYYDQQVGRFTQMDTWMGRSQDPVTLNKYLYANADPVRNIDPSGHMSLTGQMVGVNLQTSLRTVALRSDYLFRAYDSAQSLAGFLDFSRAVPSVMGQATTFSPTQASRSGIANINYQEAIDSAFYNLPRAIAAGIGDWSKGYASSKKSGAKIDAFLVYMPLLSNPLGQAGSIPILTPAKVRFENRKVPIKLVFGADSSEANGTLFGIGVDMKKSRQLVRMDYHTFNEGHGGVTGLQPSEISVFRDGSFHYHVRTWHQ